MAHTLYIALHHDQLLTLYSRSLVHQEHLVNIDLHADTHGLVYSLQQQRTFIRRPNWRRDPGNIVSLLLQQHYIRSCLWLYEPRFPPTLDFWGLTVKTQVPAGLPVVAFKPLAWDQWSGQLDSQTLLSIDWDFFAGYEIRALAIEERIEAFVSCLATLPCDVFLCYSPGYVRPSLALCQTFINQLSQQYRLLKCYLTPLREAYWWERLLHRHLRSWLLQVKNYYSAVRSD